MPKIADLRRKFEEETLNENRTAAKAYNALVNKPSTSKKSVLDSSEVVYAELSLQEPSKQVKSNKESTVYSEVLISSQKYVFIANELLQNLDSNKSKIEELETELAEKIKNHVQTGLDQSTDKEKEKLTNKKEELTKTHQEKHTLISELKKTIPEVHTALSENLINAQHRERELEKEVNSSHGEEYIQLKSKLHEFRNEQAYYLNQNIKFEEQLLKNTDKAFQAFQSEASGKILYLCNEELALQNKIHEDLIQEKKVIDKNLDIHTDKIHKTLEYKKYAGQQQETLTNLVSCEERISILKNEIATRETAFQDEEVEWGTIGAFQSVQKDGKNILKKEEEVLKFWEKPLSEEKEQIKQGAISKKTPDQSLAVANPTPPAVNRELKPSQSRLAASTLFSSKDNGTHDEKKSKEKNTRLVTENENPQGPAVNRELKPSQSRLAASTLFSSLSPKDKSTQDEEKSKEKARTKGYFATS